jgi:hypothetical protein
MRKIEVLRARQKAQELASSPEAQEIRRKIKSGVYPKFMSVEIKPKQAFKTRQDFLRWKNLHGIIVLGQHTAKGKTTRPTKFIKFMPTLKVMMEG